MNILPEIQQKIQSQIIPLVLSFGYLVILENKEVNTLSLYTEVNSY